MAERGRKSAASLSVVAGSIDGRPKAPDDLTKEQKVIWDKAVANEAADVFKTQALQQLLKEYCRHAASALKLARMIEAMERLRAMSDVDLEGYDRHLHMRDGETKENGRRACREREG